MPGTGTGTAHRQRAFAALALTTAANVAVLQRGPGHSLGISLLLTTLACGGLGWLLWEQRVHVLIGRKLVLLISSGLLVFAVLQPPTSSHDVWSYVMIGRTIAVHHSNPYEHPSSAFRNDPFRLNVDPVWRHARSVYGPVFSAMAVGAVKVAGDSPYRNRIAFQTLAALAAFAALLIIDRTTRGDPRAIAFVGLNLIVVVTTVNNAHNDAYVGLAALGAVVLARKRPLMAGALLGLAALVKIAAVLPAGVLALWLWQRREKVAGATLLGGAAAVTAAGYLFAGSAAVTVLSSARDRMNRGSLWYPVREVLAHLHVGDHATSRALQIGREAYNEQLASLSTFAVIALAAWIAYRARRDAPVVVAAAVIAYTVLGAYILPWYMVWGLPVLALVWRTRMAWLAMALALVLELAYLPDDRPTGVLRGPFVHTFMQRVQIDLRVFGLPLLELAAVIALLVWSASRAGRVEFDNGTTEAGAQTPPGDEAESLDDGLPRELRAAGGPIGEDDRHLADAGAGRRGPVDRLDLEGVAVGSRVIELDAAHEVGSVDLVAGGAVGDVEAEREADVAVGPTGQGLPPSGPAGRD
jgi:hypothetical protein